MKRLKNVQLTAFAFAVIIIGLHLISGKSYEQEIKKVQVNLPEPVQNWLDNLPTATKAEKDFAEAAPVFLHYIHLLNTKTDNHLQPGAMLTQLRLEHFGKYGANKILKEGLNVGNIKARKGDKTINAKDDCFTCEGNLKQEYPDSKQCNNFCRRNSANKDCVKANCGFTKNQNLNEGMINYTLLFTGSDARYKKVMEISKNVIDNKNYKANAKKIFQELKSKGYATDANYVASLTRLYEKLDMEELDEIYYQSFAKTNNLPVINNNRPVKNTTTSTKMKKDTKPDIKSDTKPNIKPDIKYKKAELEWAVKEYNQVMQKINQIRIAKQKMPEHLIQREVELRILLSLSE